MNSIRETLAFALGMAVLLAIVAHVCGCAVTCKIIDLADQACPLVVQYTDKAGTKRTVVISNEDARGVAAHRDAGAP